MTFSVNGMIIPEEALQEEMARLGPGPVVQAAARRTLAIRELLLQEAGERGLLEDGAPRSAVTFADRQSEEAVIDRLLAQEVRTPEPHEDECRRHYEAHASRFVAGELVAASHILFALTPGTPVQALRERAGAALAELVADPSLFAQRAGELSNCPSGAQGGSLGQFGRGEMAPEFEKAIFDTTATGVLPSLVATRHGFHIVLVEQRLPGRPLPFEAVRERIAVLLAARVQERALRQYVTVLAGRADIRGVELESVSTPLVQ
jgi:peptidyl-prolyl cis-trans isomerase C